MSDRRRLLREMTWAYLARPDPVAWLAAADIYEEMGDVKNASRWRRRGELFSPLLGAYMMFWEEVKKSGGQGVISSRFPLGAAVVRISQTTTGSSLAVEVTCGNAMICVFVVRTYDPRTRYVTAKLMKVVNWIITRREVVQ